ENRDVDGGLCRHAATSLRRRASSHASIVDGIQKFVTVTSPHTATRTPPKTSATALAPAANRTATVASQTVASLNACRRRTGLGGSSGGQVRSRSPRFQRWS